MWNNTLQSRTVKVSFYSYIIYFLLLFMLMLNFSKYSQLKSITTHKHIFIKTTHIKWVPYNCLVKLCLSLLNKSMKNLNGKQNQYENCIHWLFIMITFLHIILQNVGNVYFYQKYTYFFLKSVEGQNITWSQPIS